jgi:hypothetical protein
MPAGRHAVIRNSGSSRRAIAVTAGGCTTPSGKARFYKRDFAGAGSRWSPKTIERPPRGERRFLGGFVNEPVSIAVHKLPAHDYVRLSFDLLILMSWDGSGLTGHGPKGPIAVGPDVLNIAVADGPLLFAHTFSNIPDDRGFEAPTKFQSFPSPVPGDLLPAQTGAAERNTLGYRYEFGPGFDMDAIYRITILFPHKVADLRLEFTAPNLQTITAGPNLPDEYWGLDDVQVDPLAARNVQRPNASEAKALLEVAIDSRDPISANQAYLSLLAGGDETRGVLLAARDAAAIDWTEVDRLLKSLRSGDATTQRFASEKLVAMSAAVEMPIRRALRGARGPARDALQTTLNALIARPIEHPALRRAAVANRVFEILGR